MKRKMHQPKVYEAVMPLLEDVSKDAKILDLGCGYGELATYLKRRGCWNIQQFDKKIRREGIRFIDLDQKFPFKTKSVDVIFLVDVIEHTENVYHTFRECHRVLKKNGILILTTPNNYNIFNKIYYFFTDKFIEFNVEKKISIGHLNPFFYWKIPPYFKIDTITYNRGWIYLLRIPFFIKNRLFGQTLILRLSKKVRRTTQ